MSWKSICIVYFVQLKIYWSLFKPPVIDNNIRIQNTNSNNKHRFIWPYQDLSLCSHIILLNFNSDMAWILKLIVCHTPNSLLTNHFSNEKWFYFIKTNLGINIIENSNNDPKLSISIWFDYVHNSIVIIDFQTSACSFK